MGLIVPGPKLDERVQPTLELIENPQSPVTKAPLLSISTPYTASGGSSRYQISSNHRAMGQFSGVGRGKYAVSEEFRPAA